MADVLETIRHRRSIRRFSPQQVGEAALRQVLEAVSYTHLESAMDCYGRPSSLGCEKNSPLGNHVQEDDRGLREADER